MRIFHQMLRHETLCHALLIILLPLFASCKSSPNLTYAPGDQPLKDLDLEKVMTFDLSRNAPLLNQNWLLHFSKQKQDWVITSSMGIPEIKDNAANPHLIHHLLDALTSTRIEGRAPNGPLGAFQLDPPTYALKITTDQQTYEIRLGDQNPNQPQTIFALITDPKPWVISTPAIQILKSLTSWESLRRQTIAFETPDDIDEMKIIQNKKTVFYTQRDGDEWSDEAHRPAHASVDQILKQLLSSSNAHPVEDPSQLSNIQSELKSHTQHVHQILLSGPFIAPISMRLFKMKGKPYLHYSRRSQIYFEISDQIYRQIKSLKNQKSKS